MRPYLYALAALLAAAPAAATTYVMVADPVLADQAAVIAVVRVAEAKSAPVRETAATDYRVSVERLIQGRVPEGLLTVRVPGGIRPDGTSLAIWGAPQLRPGERALLFLAANRDGSFHILHLMLGAFREISSGGKRLAVRDLSEAVEVGGKGEGASERPRDLDRFANWLADRAAGRRREADYFAAGPHPGGEKFDLLDQVGVKMRWFEFDGGVSVAWAAHRAGQAGTPAGGFEAFQRGLAAWTDEPTTAVSYSYAGETDATGGLTKFDGVNAITFGQALDDPFDCAEGGVLAIGGPWFTSTDRGLWQGQHFFRILGADIVTNTGIDCFFAANRDPGAAAEELFGHELGHTLGIGHSCNGIGCDASAEKNDALMRAFVHGDGRGARLNGDDRAALQALYLPAAAPDPAAWTAARTGEAVDLRIHAAGRIRAARWDFTTGVGFSDAPCSTDTFCASHIFDRPGTYTVTVTLIGNEGKTSKRTVVVRVEGVAVELPPGAGSFLQSVALHSDVWLHNAGEYPTLVRLAYRPRIGASGPLQREVTIAPGTSLLLRNVLPDLFGRAGEEGSLTLSYHAPLSAGGSRPEIFAFSRSSGAVVGGRFGQLVAEEPDSTWAAEEKMVAGLLEGGGFAASLLVANLDEATGRVTIELRDGSGRQVGNPAVLDLGPHTLKLSRVAELFPAALARTGPFSARFTSDGIRFSASATLSDAESTKAIFVPGVAALPDAASRSNRENEEVFIPRVVRGRGQFGTVLASRLVASNVAAQPRTLTFELWLRGRDNTAPLSARRTLAPGASLFVADVVRDLFGLEAATGAMRVTWQGGASGPAPRILSFTFSSTPDGKRSGMLVDGRPPDEAVTTRGVDFGAEQSDLAHSSYGAVNLAVTSTTLRLTLRNSAGQPLGTAELRLKPRQHLERGLETLFPGLIRGDHWFVETTVESGRVLTYLSAIDSSGALLFLPGRRD